MGSYTKEGGKLNENKFPESCSIIVVSNNANSNLNSVELRVSAHVSGTHITGTVIHRYHLA